MAFIMQKHETDCGVAALAMLCDVGYEDAYRVIPWRRHGCQFGTDTKMLRTAALRLGYEGRGTPKHQLKRIHMIAERAREVGIKAGRYPSNLHRPLPEARHDEWNKLPDNSLVKVEGGPKGAWHWVVWAKGKVYDPARGVFRPSKYDRFPVAYMEFKKNG